MSDKIDALRKRREELSKELEIRKDEIKRLSQSIRDAEYVEAEHRAVAKIRAKRGDVVMKIEPVTVVIKPKK